MPNVEVEGNEGLGLEFCMDLAMCIGVRAWSHWSEVRVLLMSY